VKYKNGAFDIFEVSLNRRRIFPQEGEKIVNNFWFSPNGRYVLLASGRRKVEVFDLLAFEMRDGKRVIVPKRIVEENILTRRVDFSQNSKYLALTSNSGISRIFGLDDVEKVICERRDVRLVKFFDNCIEALIVYKSGICERLSLFTFGFSIDRYHDRINALGAVQDSDTEGLRVPREAEISQVRKKKRPKRLLPWSPKAIKRKRAETNEVQRRNRPPKKRKLF